MKDLALFILKNIVDRPDAVKVTESVNDEGLTVLTVTVAEEDMGKVIGKNGKVINAVRQVLKIAAIRQNQRVNLTLTEPEGERPPVTKTTANASELDTQTESPAKTKPESTKKKANQTNPTAQKPPSLTP